MLNLIQHPPAKGWALNQVQGDEVLTMVELLPNLPFAAEWVIIVELCRFWN